MQVSTRYSAEPCKALSASRHSQEADRPMTQLQALGGGLWDARASLVRLGGVWPGVARPGGEWQGKSWAVNSLKHRGRCLGMRSASMARRAGLWSGEARFTPVRLGELWAVNSRLRFFKERILMRSASASASAARHGTARYGQAGHGPASYGLKTAPILFNRGGLVVCSQ